MLDDNRIKVSVMCITYNQDQYIGRCLEGFVSQKTNFDYEVFVHDDASTDKTKSIILDYYKRYPSIIIPIFEEENQYSKGISISRDIIFPRTKGKYIAICDGDDCWVCDEKLQIQYDFMESHPDYAYCCHCTDYFEPDGRRNYMPHISEDRDYSTEEIIREGVLFHWSSVFIKREVYDTYPACFKAKGFSDWQMFIYGSICGKCHVFSRVMSWYNHGISGSWTKRTISDQEKRIAHGKEIIRMLHEVDKYYDGRYSDAIRYAIHRAEYGILKITNDFQRIKKEPYRTFYVSEKRANRLDRLKKELPFLVNIKKLFRT